MQKDFTYYEHGTQFAMKLWTEQEEAVEQARVLTSRTTVPHRAEPLGEYGWVCFQETPAMYIGADGGIAIHPKCLMRYIQLAQAAKESRAHLEMDYPSALSQVRKSWVKLNPLGLEKPAEESYAEAALFTVFLLDKADPDVSMVEGVRMVFEQQCLKRAPQQLVEAIGQNITAWWNKHVAVA